MLHGFDCVVNFCYLTSYFIYFLTSSTQLSYYIISYRKPVLKRQNSLKVGTDKRMLKVEMQSVSVAFT